MPDLRFSRTIRALSIVGIALALASGGFFTLTGSLFPVYKVDTLRHPLPVSGWTSEGLTLTDGRTVPLRGVHALPLESVALAQVIGRGVEINADGRVYGLVKVHHWCGNDPVRRHIAKVDIAEMLIFLRVGRPTVPLPEPQSLVKVAGGRFTESGWRVGEFHDFQLWQRMKDPGRGN